VARMARASSRAARTSLSARAVSNLVSTDALESMERAS
jgi:hypothetical protein